MPWKGQSANWWAWNLLLGAVAVPEQDQTAEGKATSLPLSIARPADRTSDPTTAPAPTTGVTDCTSTKVVLAKRCIDPKEACGSEHRVQPLIGWIRVDGERSARSSCLCPGYMPLSSADLRGRLRLLGLPLAQFSLPTTAHIPVKAGHGSRCSRCRTL